MHDSIPAALRKTPDVPLAERSAWSAADVASAYGLSLRFVMKLVADKKIPSRLVGRRRLFDPKAVHAALLGE